MYVTAIIVILPVYIFTDLHESCGDYELACGDGACIDHVCHSYHCGTTYSLFTDLHESCGDYEFACGDGACLLVDHVCHSYHCGTTCLYIYRSP